MKSFRTRFGFIDIWKGGEHDGWGTLALIIFIIVLCVIVGVVQDCSNPYVGWIQ